jgi:hypothetical protein
MPRAARADTTGAGTPRSAKVDGDGDGVGLEVEVRAGAAVGVLAGAGVRAGRDVVGRVAPRLGAVERVLLMGSFVSRGWPSS